MGAASAQARQACCSLSGWVSKHGLFPGQWRWAVPPEGRCAAPSPVCAMGVLHIRVIWRY
ncbi:hypothetical protein FOMG_19654 [Fusarium oxysporum f. sp. melonis 26406]|uniref:Uncharacterized protein n=1 Tax=Fusarium oxysporum f. sp. melonis 26406 TaxID=1089452 RepID=W9YWQ6_FUSOX|nr:hypothetical protein FOMG_19654 [Fusarium oxysporum f. sp. melonis 26406]